MHEFNPLEAPSAGSNNFGPRVWEPGDRKLLGEALRPGWPRRARRLRTARLNALICAQKPADASRFRGHLHETRIKLPSRILLEFFHGPGKAHRLAIRPVSRHRINGIGDHDDARADGDLLTREPVWIARSVEVLVMVSD